MLWGAEPSKWSRLEGVRTNFQSREVESCEPFVGDGVPCEMPAVARLSEKKRFLLFFGLLKRGYKKPH
jgi:hypothetical protein